MKSFIVTITFIWVGMILGISFLEAPLKFTAPNITLELGIGIGQVVFGVLNKIEIAFSLALIGAFAKEKLSISQTMVYLLAVLIVILQTFWLLPLLDIRAEMILSGQEIQDSYHHLCYVVMEVIKTIALLYAGLKYLNTNTLNS